MQVKLAFENSFAGWIFSIDSIADKNSKSSNVETSISTKIGTSISTFLSFFGMSTKASDDQTIIKCNFIDKDSYTPINKYDVQT